MQKFVIHGGRRLEGEVTVQGAKNSALPILAAALLCEEPCELQNCPRLSDVYAACRILSSLGCRCSVSGHTVRTQPGPVEETWIPEHLMQEMRSSIIFLGAMLGRTGACTLGYPGGCELGPRPIDLHLSALRRMGVRIREEGGVLRCIAPGGLHGAKIHLQFPSVGATENILLAAVLAQGETLLTNAAREPEITDLAGFLRAAGARIEGDGSSTVYVEGVKSLHGCTYRIMPDRIAAATWMAAAAACGGELVLRGAAPSGMESLLDVFEQMHCRVRTEQDILRFHAVQPLHAVRFVRTMPYPGFPTDAQAIVMAVLCTARGTSLMEETIFENRFRHVDALTRMGADIRVAGRVASVHGVPALHGAQVAATDLRGGAAMLTAALGAQGETVLSEISHIDRGYDAPEEVLRSLGADIERV
ncbi:MAG: UDP-N-acetylglucosamine 1-carboxyvinyltransferase [Oscillospiraceae bacterium]|nr:UDP-N-acetylglucosamine 1-carboxyvinyltransferase [Oscillospiraceae bacterium]